MPGETRKKRFKDPIRRFSQELWDLRLKLSPATRTLAECERFDPNNVEFAISLLDCRYLAGDRDLFARLHDKVGAPARVARNVTSLIQNLGDLTRSRHHKFGNTVFHLEPNVKDGPGGLRDYNVTYWLALISAMEKLQMWPDPKALLPVSSRQSAGRTRLTSRCRYALLSTLPAWAPRQHPDMGSAGRSRGPQDRRHRDAKSRTPPTGCGSTSATREPYIASARSCWKKFRRHGLPLVRQFQSWRLAVSTPDFSVVDGLIFVQQAGSLQDPEMLLRLFHFMAEQGLKLSTTTEYKIEQVLPALASTPPRGAELWLYLQETLMQPHAADALRAMNALRLLPLLLPELKGIEALVVRDFYHRYTVDEHSFLAIEHLHRLQGLASRNGIDDSRNCSVNWSNPNCSTCRCCFMIPARQLPGDNHVEASLTLTESCADRLDLEPADRETLRYLVGSHLEMSAAMRRDVFDPANVRSFAEKVGAPERLKMLCLMTYADIKAVNPEAMTPWKADNLWQLYIAAANYLSRSADERVHADDNDATLAHLRSLAPVAGKKINNFLEGLPQRYLRIHGVSDVLAHAEMAAQLGNESCPGEPEAGSPLVRVDPDHHRPALSLCFDFRRAGGVGNEYRQGKRVFERRRHGSRHLLSSLTVSGRWSSISRNGSG